ncbi:MAG TPA: carboxypeptidase-like regulatory domain-containing protein [Terriglobia bacterium]|nr:carboxypeptidase-like regulatory domain-containing protein [Terriglobia bacterium]
MRIKGIWFSILPAMCLAATIGMRAQEIRGLIVGNVTDSSGAAVPGAQITIRNEGTGIEYKTTTEASGTYTVPDLLAGTYTLTVAKGGFRTFQAKGIELLSAQTARQDVVLQVGAVVQTVKVSGHAQLVQTDSPTIGGTLATRELADLPFMTTATDGLMNLVPGMSQGITNGNSNPDIGGAAYVGTSNWTVNGISTNNPGQGGGGNVTYIGTSEMIAQANLPAIGTLQEFKVESSVNGAEFRSQTAVTMVTKQGTNSFHGQVFEYNENKATSANSFDLNKYNEDETPFNRNQFGANIGGPILRDKMFFFVSYDGIREIHPTPVQANFPTPAMKQGDLSNLCDTWSAAGLCTDTANGQQLYNPLTGQPFLNNQIPSSMITTQAKVLSNYLLAPNVNFAPTPASGGGEFLQGSPFALYDWAGALPLRFGTNNAQMRLDGQLSSKDSVVAFATVSKGAPWFYGFACCPNFGNWSDHGYNWYNFSGTETHTFGPGTINEFRLGAVVTAMRSFGENLGFEPQSLFPQMPVNEDRGLPTISLNGYQGPYDVGAAHSLQNTADWVDNLTMVRGRHTIKTGFEETGYKEDDFCWFTCGSPLGSFGISGQWSGNRGWNIPGSSYGQSLGNAYADFLLGDADSSSYAAPTNQRMYDREWDFYTQDTFKASPRLTLSYGVRYMFQRPWTFKDHDATFWDPAINKLVIQENSSTVTVPPGADPGAFAAYPFVTTQQIGAPLNYFKNDLRNWAPRIGFAYRPSGNNKTVIRGGWGMYYAFNAAWSGPLQSLSNLPWERTAGFSTQLPGSPTTAYLPDITFANPYPSGLIQGEAANPSVWAMDRNELNPRTQQWNLTLERQVGDNWAFRGSYVGAQGHHLLSQYNNINRPSVQQAGVPYQQQLPYQPWSSIYWFNYPGTSNFDQLQLEVQKRFANGLTFRTEYDWSRNLTNINADNEAGGIPPQNPWNLRAEYSNEEFQYRHKFLVYYVYELPVGHGRKWLGSSNKFVDGVLGGWRVSGITTYHSGDALSPTFENPGTLVGWDFVTRPDRVAGAPLYAGRQSGHDTVTGVQWFNPGAFAPPQPYTYGNASPFSIFGPGFGDWDLSAMKSFRIHNSESTKLEFKVDFFNLPNHYNLGDPDTGIYDVRDGGVVDAYSGKITGGAGAYAPRLIQIGLRLML